jgi:hypothetical protein
MQSTARAAKSHLRLDPNIRFLSEFNGLNDRFKLISFKSNPVKAKILRKPTEYYNMALLGDVVGWQEMPSFLFCRSTWEEQADE